MLIDTHCHLDAPEFDEDRDAVIGRAHAAGVDLMVLPAVAAEHFDPVRKLAARHAGLRYSLGIHPLWVDRAQDEDLLKLRSSVVQALQDPAFVGIGEIGLDHFVPDLDRARQLHFFVAQLALAREFDLPVILHVRRSQDTVLRELRRFRLSGGIAHAFNGSFQQAQVFIDLGFALGFGGAMTFGRALQIRRLAAQLPAEALVLETDAPDIAPAWLGAADASRAGVIRNAPAELPRIAEVLAELRATTLESVLGSTSANAMRVLPRLRPTSSEGAMA